MFKKKHLREIFKNDNVFLIWSIYILVIALRKYKRYIKQNKERNFSLAYKMMGLKC